MSQSDIFTTNYAALNDRQKQAVDTIEGPVMVVAGPGTGKTQLLSMRVAAILRRTDVLPSNILCLTFTESAATAMRQRLVSMMGQDAYKVAIHTFHSFGSEVINHYADYFYQGAHFRPADALSSYEVLQPIFEKLSHDSPLASSMNGEFTALRDAQSAIGSLKKAGLTPDELLKVLDHNEAFVAYAEPILHRAFDTPRFSKKNLAACESAKVEIEKYHADPMPVPLVKPLHETCAQALSRALDEANELGSTKPMTAFRDAWIERDRHKTFVFKDHARAKKLRALADVYHKYLLGMQERELYDFDDMILRVVHALEYFPELRYNLQEQYQYILVDEFQDTNGAQLRLLRDLSSSDVNEGRPNVLVVGDDDQAVYAFQGADISNILEFRDLYQDPTIITLVDNYRSTKPILDSARIVVAQGHQRLETTIDGVDKTLTAHQISNDTHSTLHQFGMPVDQYQWIITEIKRLQAEGIASNEIAILGRNHRQLLDILPYLHQANIPVNYERRNNVLESEHITALVLMARVVVGISQQRFDIVEALLPELLSYEFWGLKTEALWQASLRAYKHNKLWLEVMLEDDGPLKRIAEFFVIMSREALHEPLELMLDYLVGTQERQVADDAESEDSDGLTANGPHEDLFVSPLRDYYFNASRLSTSPGEYLRLLSNLTTIRRHLREYRPDQPLQLSDFVAFVDLHHRTRTSIVDVRDQHESDQAINLMTAHKSKGLEFDTVFVMSCQENVWGQKARTKINSISFPRNLPIGPVGQTADDCMRLLFVAMTRAKRQLSMSWYQKELTGKDSMPVSFLQIDGLETVVHPALEATHIVAETLDWQRRHLETIATDSRVVLKPQLESYQLSATHLNNFLDVTGGGPQAFLLQNILRFPQAMSSNAVFGSAVHAVLQRAHAHLTSSGEQKPVEDILHDFETHLQNAQLSERDFTHLLEKGSAVLPRFLAARYDQFHPEQRAEYSFRSQGVILHDKVRLTGAIDLMTIDKDSRSITVIDYKTGKPASSWQGRHDFEKIKLHKYRQQLMLYKLLVEGSRDFGGTHTVTRGVIQFVEPNEHGEIRELEMHFAEDEFARFKALVVSVWNKIMELDLPDISKYPQNYKGIEQFEDDLLRQD